ncbi:MAG: hypothetical protein N3F63_01625 [Thermoplasmata archaeon]|nr:hypothetical protein [Thermoplasmata archaeon]
MDGMQQFKKEINKIRALADTPEITIIAIGSQASRVLNVFAAQTLLRNVRTVVIDTSENIKGLENIQTKMLLPADFAEGDVNAIASNMNLPRSDIIVILAALGGHTSSLLAPIVAEIGKRMGCLVVAVPILPFSFERERREHAEKVLAHLKQTANIVTVLDNDHIPKKLKLSDTPTYTARRLQTLLDNLLPAVPFAIVDKLLKEIEEETKRITLQVHKSPLQQIILSAGNSQTEVSNPIVVEEIVVEKLNEEAGKNQNEIISMDKDRAGGAIDNLVAETEIAEKVRECMEPSDNSMPQRAPEQPGMPQKPKPEKEVVPETELNNTG